MYYVFAPPPRSLALYFYLCIFTALSLSLSPYLPTSLSLSLSLSLFPSVYMYIYIYTYMYVCVCISTHMYIYIYIKRERATCRDRDVYMCAYDLVCLIEGPQEQNSGFPTNHQVGSKRMVGTSFPINPLLGARWRFSKHWALDRSSRARVHSCHHIQPLATTLASVY